MTRTEKVRVHSREFRLQIVRRIQNGENVPQLANELGIHRKLLYQWLRQVNEGGEANLRERGRPRKEESAPAAANSSKRIADLEQTVRRQNDTIEVLHLAVRHLEARAASTYAWRQGVYSAIDRALEESGKLSVDQMCEIFGVSRSGYYRYRKARPGTA